MNGHDYDNGYDNGYRAGMQKTRYLAQARIEELEAQQKIDWANINTKADFIENTMNDIAFDHAQQARSDLPPSAEVIRGMIKPLVWASIPEFAYVTTPHGQYQVRETENNGWYVQLDCLQVGVLEDGLESQNLGIEIANEHHANTILAALGLTEGKDK